MIDIDRLDAAVRGVEDARREILQLTSINEYVDIACEEATRRLDHIDSIIFPQIRGAIKQHNESEEKAKLESHKGSQ